MGHTSLWYFPPNPGRWRVGCAVPLHRYPPFYSARSPNISALHSAGFSSTLRSLPSTQFRQSPDCTVTSRPLEVDHAGASDFCACRKKPAHTNVKLKVLCRSLSTSRGGFMRLARFLTFVSGAFLLLASAALFLFRSAPTASAQTTTPPSSTISSTTGPLAWDFAPVGGGTVTNVGIQDICPPGMCDDHDLNIVLPSATFYQTMTAQVTFKYTWTSTVPTDLDIFAISPNGADHGPGSPDDTSTGPGEEDLTLTDPLPGLWHIRSVASLVPLPTTAHVVVTMTVAPRPTTPPPPPPAPGAPAFIIYPAPNDCVAGRQAPSCIQTSPGSTTAGEPCAGEPSIRADWATRKVFIQAGNHTLRVTLDDSLSPATAFWEYKRSPFAPVS